MFGIGISIRFIASCEVVTEIDSEMSSWAEWARAAIVTPIFAKKNIQTLTLISIIVISMAFM